MKTLFIFFIVLLCSLTIACSGEPTINGKNNRSAASTMRKVKNYMLNDQKLEFEISYWTVREAIGNNRKFLSTVDGKTGSEIIELGKESFSERKAAGIPAYTKYASWDDMLGKVSAEREAAALPEEQLSKKDKANNVLYNLSNM